MIPSSLVSCAKLHHEDDAEPLDSDGYWQFGLQFVQHVLWCKTLQKSKTQSASFSFSFCSLLTPFSFFFCLGENVTSIWTFFSFWVIYTQDSLPILNHSLRKLRSLLNPSRISFACQNESFYTKSNFDPATLHTQSHLQFLRITWQFLIIKLCMVVNDSLILLC